MKKLSLAQIPICQILMPVKGAQFSLLNIACKVLLVPFWLAQWIYLNLLETLQRNFIPLFMEYCNSLVFLLQTYSFNSSAI